ncbi:22756_t:CDS:2 [Dentiscutata erythropus]|uniref:22756_t:CDS:1 n=1 Tax=Dentiscutata erythropus TaxID=1348616 RepID=A0A9N9CUT7_9GLOM|nr:22756_t:CDS:2 [Dentiscutata erythropus]
MSQSQSQIPKVGDKFPTVESFKEAVQQSAKVAGFAFSVSSSKVSGGGKGGHTPFVVLQCVMGDKYRNNHQITEETQKRKKSTKRQNCPVSLRAVLNKDTKVWVVTTSKNKHNHELLLPSQVHCFPQHWYLTTEQKKLVHIMLKSGASTQSIADAIHWKNGMIYTKDIMNERDRIKNALNEGTNCNTTMCLLQMLEECQYIVRHVLTKDGYMLNLFFTHNEAALFVSDRALALRKAADRVFPDAKKMVCIWHMLLQNLRTTLAYAEEMCEVEKAFNEVNKAVIKSKDPKYIQDYLEEWKKDAEYWMHVFTKNYPHMGIQSTQRAEGSHATLKKAIEAASLEQVFLHIDRAFRQRQLRTTGPLGLNIVFADPFICNDLRFELLLGKISKWAIDRIKKEICEIGENKNLDKKYENLNNSGSKATLLHKIEELATEEIPVPKAPLHTVSNKHPTSTKRDPLLNGDGNCGYRAVAVCLKRNENEWSEIRKELLKELIEKEQFYRMLFFANDDYDVIKKEITWESGPCTFEHWMKMPQMGHVIANTYQRPLYFFSLQISLTFLPYHHSLNRNEALAIVFINNNHYVPIVLRASAPVPPIVNRWTQFATSAAIHWKLLIQDRIIQLSSTSKTDLENK